MLFEEAWWRRRYSIAIDANRAVKREIREVGDKPDVLPAAEVMLHLIRAGVLDIATADRIKEDYELHHRFKIKADSFRLLL